VNGYEGWTTESQILASVLDALNAANWQRAGNKNARKPTPLERPWDKPRARYGSGAMPYDEIDAWMKSTWR
jgi:hypothetical protein